MSEFTEKLQYRRLPKKHWWSKQFYEVTEVFVYRIGYENSSDKVIVPKGFTTDFASTPFWIHWKYPPINWYAKAVLIHDLLYRSHNYLTDIPTQNIRDLKVTIGKSRADEIMVESMEVLARSLVGYNIPKEMQLTIDRFYWAVTHFGGSAWKKNFRAVPG